MRRIVSSFLLLMFIVSSAWADPTVNVTTKTIMDMASGDPWDITGIPRPQIGAMHTAGQLAIYNSKGFRNDRIKVFSVKDFWADPLVVNFDSIATIISEPANHAHTDVYYDTFYVSFIDSGGMGVSRIQLAYRINPSTGAITRVFKTQMPFLSDDDQYAAPIYHLPGSDTAIYLSRSDGTPLPQDQNLLYWISPDGGRTWDSMGYALDWHTMTTRQRVGCVQYRNTFCLVADSADQWIVTAYFDRTAGAFVHNGASSNCATDGFRAFGAVPFNNDTCLITVLTKDEAGATTNDSCIYSYKYGSGSWVRGAFLMSTGNTASPPYVALTYIEAANRPVIFFSKNNGTDDNDFDIYGRYWKPDSNKWSDEFPVETRTGRGALSFKMVTSGRVPTEHGDVAYVGYPMDTVVSGVTHHRIVISAVSFEEEIPPENGIEITSLPYTLATSDTLYTTNAAGGKLCSGTYGLTIVGGLHDVVVDFGGDTLCWGTDGNEADSGTTAFGSKTDWGEIDNTAIWMRNLAAYNVTFRNIVFLHTPPDSTVTDSSYNLWANCIRLGAQQANIDLENCTFIVKGRNAKVLWADNSGDLAYNIEMRNCVFYDSCNSYTRRDQWPQQSMINIQGSNSTEPYYPAIPFEYHFKMTACSVATAFWCNVHLEGDSTVALLDSSYFESDGWNKLTGCCAGIYDAATENFIISLRQGDVAIPDGVRILVQNCTFRSGENHTGSSGWFISGVEGMSSTSDDSSVCFRNNTMLVHQGWDGYIDYVKAVICREDWGNVRIHNNTFDLPHYHTPPDSSYGDGPGQVLRLTENFGYGLYFKHNTASAYFVDAFTFDAQNGSNGEQVSIITADECDMNSANIRIDSNFFYSNNLFFDMGFGNGQGGNFTSIIGNTFGFYGGTSSNNSSQWVWYAGDAWHNTVNSYGNYLQDCIFEDGIDETHLFLDDGQTDSLQIGLKATVPITVLDGSAAPIPGASVTVTDGYGNVVASGTTNGSGMFTPVLKYYDLYNATWDDNVGPADAVDSTGFNPFVFHASYAGDTDDSTYTVSSSARSMTLTLATTVAPDPPPSISLRRGLNLRRGINLGNIANGPGDGVDYVPPEP